MAALSEILNEMLYRNITSEEVVLSGGLRLRYVQPELPENAEPDTPPPPPYLAAYRFAPQAPSEQEIITLIHVLNNILNRTAPDGSVFCARRSRLATKTIKPKDGPKRAAKGYHLTWDLAPVAQLV